MSGSGQSRRHARATPVVHPITDSNRFHGLFNRKMDRRNGQWYHYDVLEVDTRGPFKGPRAYDSSGLPLHFDNQSTFKERLHLDKSDPNILHDEITVFDHALTRPWSVDKTFQRYPDPHPVWMEQDCNDGNVNIVIGKENYFLSADRLLMPAKKDQAPPDLRYFRQTQK